MAPRRRRPAKSTGTFYVSGPYADDRLHPTARTALSYALTCTERGAHAKQEVTHYVRDLFDRVLGYVESSADGSSTVVMHQQPA